MNRGLWYLTPLSTVFQLYRGGIMYKNIMYPNYIFISYLFCGSNGE